MTLRWIRHSLRFNKTLGLHNVFRQNMEDVEKGRPNWAEEVTSQYGLVSKTLGGYIQEGVVQWEETVHWSTRDTFQLQARVLLVTLRWIRNSLRFRQNTEDVENDRPNWTDLPQGMEYGLVSNALCGYLQEGMVQREEKDRGDRQERVVLQEGTILQEVNYRKNVGHQGEADLHVRQMTEDVVKVHVDRREVVRQVLLLLLLLVVSSAAEGAHRSLC